MVNKDVYIICVFFVKKYSNTSAKILKSALLDFYDDEALSAAKQQLLKDFNSIRLQLEMDSVPHIPQRRRYVCYVECSRRTSVAK